jgi:hypothetical protein
MSAFDFNGFLIRDSLTLKFQNTIFLNTWDPTDPSEKWTCPRFNSSNKSVKDVY